MDECVWLAIITLDEAEALHGVEELDGARRGFTGQRALNAGATFRTVAEATAVLTGRRCTVFNRKRFAIDDEIRCGNLSTTIHERVAKRLAFGETGKAEALAKGEALVAEKMQAITAGLPLPPGMKLPF